MYVEEENAEIISVFTASRLTFEILKKFKNLKLILTRSVGYSHSDIEYCKENFIHVEQLQRIFTGVHRRSFVDRSRHRRQQMFGTGMEL